MYDALELDTGPSTRTWIPHLLFPCPRSSTTYPEWQVREAYYASMAQRRKEYMERMQREMEESYKREAAAFATIPTSSVRSKGEIDQVPHTN
jgi:hypothetical protein